jgi:hypothetical protein
VGDPFLISRRIRLSRIAPAIWPAFALVACTKTPDPPGQCNLVQVNVDWEQFHPIAQQVNFDSLRSLVAKAEEGGARAHRLQEYVFAANRLDPPARQAALASVAEVLERVRKQ